MPVSPDNSRLTIVIPCLNEAHGITSVIHDFQSHFPGSALLVIDNASTDATAEIARKAGAKVHYEPRPGKAQAIRTAFDLVQTDWLLMVDGDASYPAIGGLSLWEEKLASCDMVTGIRLCASAQTKIFRPFHQAGTGTFNKIIGLIFGPVPRDVFSGLRLFSKKFYKNVPILSHGFSLEMELTIQAIEKGFLTAEVEVPFQSRAEGSNSKLHTIKDGLRILRTVLVLFRDYRPLFFFSLIASGLGALGLLAGSFPIYEYFTTRLVGRLPLAVLAASLVTLSLFSLLTGLVLESGLRTRRETFQIMLRHFR